MLPSEHTWPWNIHFFNVIVVHNRRRFNVSHLMIIMIINDDNPIYNHLYTEGFSMGMVCPSKTMKTCLCYQKATSIRLSPTYMFSSWYWRTETPAQIFFWVNEIASSLRANPGNHS